VPSIVSVIAAPPAFAPDGDKSDIVEEFVGVPNVVLKSLQPPANTAAATPSSNIQLRKFRNRSSFVPRLAKQSSGATQAGNPTNPTGFDTIAPNSKSTRATNCTAKLADVLARS
jgi:hypothetical protein